MATLECKSSQPGVQSKLVTIEDITDAQVAAARAMLDQLLLSEKQASNAVAKALIEISALSPAANPSDLWHHVIYRHLCQIGWNDARWKRVSGFALERALTMIYSPRLEMFGIRMRMFPQAEASRFLKSVGLDVRSTKVDLFLEGRRASSWHVFGAVHVKSSIAERIQDDVPASRAVMAHGFLSIMLTMDAKSYPPPHGECVNYGELGGRSMRIDKERIKRNYIEEDGQFDALFSFNLRTPESLNKTPSGKRIFTLGLHDSHPDQLVQFIAKRWRRPARAAE